MYDLIDAEEDFVDFDEDGIDEFGFEDEFGDDEGADEWWRDALGIGLNTAAGAAKSYLNSKHAKSWLDNTQHKGRNKALLKGAATLAGTVGDIFQAWNSEDSEVYAESVDAMEAMAHDAMAGDPTDAALAADEMVRISMGPLAGAGQLRSTMAVLQREVGRIMAQARQNPQMRAAAQVAPLALRRTAVSLARMAASGRPISPQAAMTLFRRTLSSILRSQQLRSAAMKKARMHAARYRQTRGYRPTVQRMSAY